MLTIPLLIKLPKFVSFRKYLLSQVNILNLKYGDIKMIKTQTLAPKDSKSAQGHREVNELQYNVIHAITGTSWGKTRGRNSKTISNEGRESEEGALEKMPSQMR